MNKNTLLFQAASCLLLASSSSFAFSVANNSGNSLYTWNGQKYEKAKTQPLNAGDNTVDDSFLGNDPKNYYLTLATSAGDMPVQADQYCKTTKVVDSKGKVIDTITFRYGGALHFAKSMTKLTIDADKNCTLTEGKPGPGPTPPGPQPGSVPTITLHMGVDYAKGIVDPKLGFDKDNIVLMTPKYFHCAYDQAHGWAPTCNFSLDDSGVSQFFKFGQCTDWTTCQDKWKNLHYSMLSNLSDPKIFDQLKSAKSCKYDPKNPDIISCQKTINATNVNSDPTSISVPVVIDRSAGPKSIATLVSQRADNATKQYSLKNPDLLEISMNPSADKGDVELVNAKDYFYGDLNEYRFEVDSGQDLYPVKLTASSKDGVITYFPEKLTNSYFTVDDKGNLHAKDLPAGYYQVTLDAVKKNDPSKVARQTIYINNLTGNTSHAEWKSGKAGTQTILQSTNAGYVYLIGAPGSKDWDENAEAIAEMTPTSMNTVIPDVLWMQYKPDAQGHQNTWPVDKNGNPEQDGLQMDITNAATGENFMNALAKIYHKQGKRVEPAIEMDSPVKADFSSWSSQQQDIAVDKIMQAAQGKDSVDGFSFDLEGSFNSDNDAVFYKKLADKLVHEGKSLGSQISAVEKITLE